MEMVINILLMLGAFGGGIALEMWRKRRIGQKELEMSGNGELMEVLMGMREVLQGNLGALEREKNRREKDMLRKRRVRGHVRGQQTTEKEREGKEDIPPTPPIEEREEEIKRNNNNNNSRGRARKIPSIEEIAEECQRIGTDIDPEYFWNYYQAKDKGWPRDWKSALSNWSKIYKKHGRIKEETVTAERKEVDLQEIQQREFERVLRHLQEEEAAHRKEQNHGN